jgi:hypothetical protein
MRCYGFEGFTIDVNVGTWAIGNQESRRLRKSQDDHAGAPQKKSGRCVATYKQKHVRKARRKGEGGGGRRARLEIQTQPHLHTAQLKAQQLDEAKKDTTAATYDEKTTAPSPIY